MSTIKKIFSFIIGGLATTALNVGFFVLFRRMGVPLTPAVILAWFLSVTFSYFANKKMVFQDKSTGFKAILKSMLLFYGSRAFSGLMIRAYFSSPRQDLMKAIASARYVPGV